MRAPNFYRRLRDQPFFLGEEELDRLLDDDGGGVFVRGEVCLGAKDPVVFSRPVGCLLVFPKFEGFEPRFGLKLPEFGVLDPEYFDSEALRLGAVVVRSPGAL